MLKKSIYRLFTNRSYKYLSLSLLILSTLFLTFFLYFLYFFTYGYFYVATISLVSFIIGIALLIPSVILIIRNSKSDTLSDKINTDSENKLNIIVNIVKVALYIIAGALIILAIVFVALNSISNSTLNIYQLSRTVIGVYPLCLPLVASIFIYDIFFNKYNYKKVMQGQEVVD